MMSNPWLLLIAATVALVVLIVKNWDKIKAFLAGVWDWIKRTAGAVWDFLKSVFKAGLDFLINLFLNWTGPGLIIKHWDKIKAAAMAVKDWVVEKFTAVVDFITGLPAKIATAATGMWDGIKAAFRGAINWLIDKWNNFEIRLGGQQVNLPFGLSFTVPSIVLATPNIPRLHGGGVFRAPTPGGEGLAILRDREIVTRAGRPAPQGGGGDLIINGDIILRGFLDPNDPATTRRLVEELAARLAAYNRERAA
jgi:hypothetical protein